MAPESTDRQPKGLPDTIHPVDLGVWLNFVHVIAAIVAVGANVTYTAWLRYAAREPERLPFVIRGIRRVDRTLANPAYIVVLLSGIGMIIVGPFTIEYNWIRAALVLYASAVLMGIFGFAPAIRRQLAEAEADPRSPAYAAAARRSDLFGMLMIVVVLVIVWLMVAKPF